MSINAKEAAKKIRIGLDQLDRCVASHPITMYLGTNILGGYFFLFIYLQHHRVL